MNEMFMLNSETTTVSFAVTIIDDDVPEEDESFTFGVIPPQIEGLRVLLPEQVLVVIEDDDQLRGTVKLLVPSGLVACWTQKLCFKK